jgi:hypothetical protein
MQASYGKRRIIDRAEGPVSVSLPRKLAGDEELGSDAFAEALLALVRSIDGT